jgi:tRNA threonylcarbamoyladenosine biosynthesis protein TsaE
MNMTKGMWNVEHGIWNVPDAAGWEVVAKNVARTLKPGSILALQGELGAGKTTFVQALAKALGAKRMPKSPTFSMLRTYPVKQGAIRRLLHVDAYRIEDEHDLIPLDLDAELSEPGTILVLEWPENVKAWLKKRKHETLRIRLKKSGRIASLK